ncbi:XrtV sorting system accessory protein [Sphingomonas sp. RS2018]
METIWDWITVICFGGLVVLMLQRSVEEETRDNLMEYLFPALGCGIANYIGNHYSDAGAAVTLLVVGAYVFKVLKFPAIGPNRIDRDDQR